MYIIINNLYQSHNTIHEADNYATVIMSMTENTKEVRWRIENTKEIRWRIRVVNNNGSYCYVLVPSDPKSTEFPLGGSLNCPLLHNARSITHDGM